MNIVQPIRNREDIEKMKAVLKRKKTRSCTFYFRDKLRTQDF